MPELVCNSTFFVFNSNLDIGDHRTFLVDTDTLTEAKKLLWNIVVKDHVKTSIKTNSFLNITEPFLVFLGTISVTRLNIPDEFFYKENKKIIVFGGVE